MGAGGCAASHSIWLILPALNRFCDPVLNYLEYFPAVFEAQTVSHEIPQRSHGGAPRCQEGIALTESTRAGSGLSALQPQKAVDTDPIAGVGRD